jgi:hypothetical protein
MSWMGVSTFAASFAGHVVMLDGYLAYAKNGTWGSSVEYLHTNIPEYVAINPVAYIVGHGHADHMGHLPIILQLDPTLPVFGMQEHCNDITAEMATLGQTVDCTVMLPAGAPFGSQASIPQRLFDLMPGVDLRAVKHPHSAGGPGGSVVDPPFPTEQVDSHDCLSYDLYPPDGTEPTAFGGPTSGVLSFSWQFRIGNFALGWADTTGDISGNVTVAGLGTGAEVPPVYASWPHTNVMFGSIAVSPMYVWNQQMAAIHPQIDIPIHHDPCAFDVKRSFDTQSYTLDPSIPMPRVMWLDDPGDYARPIVFDPSSDAWQ